MSVRNTRGKIVSRRSFLRGIGATAAGLALGACCPSGVPKVLTPTSSPTPVPSMVPTVPTAVPTDVPTATPTSVPTDVPTAPPTVAPTATPAPTMDVRPRVAIARAANYDRALVHQQLEAVLDGLGGLGGSSRHQG